MPPAPKSLPGLPANYTPQCFSNDIVSKLTDSSFRARVVRCWTDEEDFSMPELAPGELPHPLDRPLLRGEVGISVNAMPHPILAIVPESSLVLYQREFHIGDIVKRSLTAVESAVVVACTTEVQVENAIDARKFKGWIPWDRLRSDMAIEARDRVMYGEWVGIVEEVFEVATVRAMASNNMYHVRASGGVLEVGRTVAETFIDDRRPPALPSSAQPNSDLVVEVHAEIVFVTWNAINQELPNSEHDKHPEPERFWHNADIEKLTILDSTRYAPVQLGAIAKLRDPKDPLASSLPGWPPAYPRLNAATGASADRGGVKALRVTESRSKLRLRWQDGKETDDWSSSLVPYRNVDDYESWPGEHLVWRDDTGQRRPVCIQSFDPHKRVADVLFTDDHTRSTVSVLELDTGGPGKSNYGVGFGQQVLFCADNDSPLPEVPSLGQMGPPPPWAHVKLVNLTDTHIGYTDAAVVPRVGKGDLKAIRWWGEVVDLHLDGTVSVRLPGDEIRQAGIKELILLNDPLSEDVIGDAGLDGEDFPMEGEEGYDGSDGGWETDDGSDMGMGGIGSLANSGLQPILNLLHAAVNEAQGVEVADIELSGSEMDVEEVDPMLSATDDEDEGDGDGDVTLREEPEKQAEAGPSKPKPSSGLAALAGEAWQSFDVLEEAPADHHFISEPREGTAKAYHSRLQKEHRALMTSLPENILVRTYEDRSDLMRVLIIGPEGTPYRDAPFVFDVYLSPTKFPQEPPIVFFHSHTNGKGRCNPNLYEDGKVCLSVLGTWAGDKSESWSAKNSSLLQVFVSISGLVLVRHPYHCEPAFAKLEGTREGRVNSRHYSEKAYVLSRAFIRQALAHPPTGLEKELNYFYHTRGKLQSVIDHAKALMDKGDVEGNAEDGKKVEEEEAEEEWNEDAMGNLTVGAILTLKRTVQALEAVAAGKGQAA